MRRQTKSTDGANAPTTTGSPLSSKSTTAASLALLESLTNGTHNPFERVDGQLLERLQRLSKKHLEIEDMEDAPL